MKISRKQLRQMIMKEMREYPYYGTAQRPMINMSARARRERERMKPEALIRVYYRIRQKMKDGRDGIAFKDLPAEEQTAVHTALRARTKDIETLKVPGFRGDMAPMFPPKQLETIAGMNEAEFDVYIKTLRDE